jgi:hypothetical protein
MINAAPPRPLFRTSVGFAVSKEDLRARVDRTSLFALALLPWPMKSEAEIGYANHGVRLRSRNDGVAGLDLSERNGRCFTGGKVQNSTPKRWHPQIIRPEIQSTNPSRRKLVLARAIEATESRAM